MKDKSFLIEKGIDVERGIELLGDIDTYNELINDFLTEINEKMNDLESYINNENMEKYATVVHSIKGEAKYFGFTRLAELALNHQLESENLNIEFIKNNFNELKTEVNRIIIILKEYLGKTETVI